VVISRLDVQATDRFDPDGAGSLTSGYDPDLRSPYVYQDSAGDRTSATQYMPPLRVPCQVEIQTFEDLQQVFGGNAPNSNIAFILHSITLKRMGLIIEDGQCPKQGGMNIGVNDRIDAIEEPGDRKIKSIHIAEPLYIIRIDPGSWGMGPAGHDLKIVYTATRQATPSG
jgi:hypothetical protein